MSPELEPLLRLDSLPTPSAEATAHARLAVLALVEQPHPSPGHARRYAMGRRRPSSRRPVVLVAVIALAAITATAAVAGLSPWPSGGSIEHANGSPVLLVRGDTSHPYDPADASDSAPLAEAQSALQAAPTRPAYVPRPFTPPTASSEVAYGTCTQLSESFVACNGGSAASRAFYLVANNDGAWVPAGNCVFSTTTQACGYPYELAIDTRNTARPRMTPIR
jgi:hypothetical protein